MDSKKEKGKVKPYDTPIKFTCPNCDEVFLITLMGDLDFGDNPVESCPFCSEPLNEKENGEPAIKK